jgi:hypothetical protein
LNHPEQKLLLIGNPASTPTLALRFRQNNGPTPSGDYQPSRSLSMAGSECRIANQQKLLFWMIQSLKIHDGF